MRLKILFVTVMITAALLSAQIIRKGRPESPRFYKDDVQIFGEEIDGKVTAYWDSTTVFGEYNYSKGSLDGLQKEYYSDGKLSAEWNMKNGKRVGEGTEYYEDGSVSFKRELNGKGDGLGIEFYKNGMKKRERLYKDGVQVHVSRYNHDIKGNRYERNADELFIEAQEYGGIGMYGHAIQSYEELLAKYPDHEKAPDVKFLIAFTYHNSLHEEELAKKHYGEFLEKYPDSPLAVSAKFEMENIGQDIEKMEIFGGEK
ncbi:MAG: hypothetical protein JXN63_03835 [Candidatus Delongbacteria bacterium]|nr:hypothetical protein [Candidatus Delongbacteria bacterium]